MHGQPVPQVEDGVHDLAHRPAPRPNPSCPKVAAKVQGSPPIRLGQVHCADSLNYVHAAWWGPYEWDCHKDAAKKPTAVDRRLADELTSETSSINICIFIYLTE
jgi:hypothetical protein